MISVFQSPEELRTFALNVLKQGNLDNMPSESREAYIDKISMQVQQFVGMAVMNELSEKGSEELAKVINKDGEVDESKAKKVLAEYLPNSEEVIKQSLQNYAKLFLENISADSSEDK